MNSKSKRLLIVTQVLIFSISSSSIFGQIAGGLNETTRTDLGGRNYITGTVFGPAGNPLSERIRIRLSAMTKGEIIITTDDRGRFVFSGLGNGLYTVNFDGDNDFEPASQQIEIANSRGVMSQSYSVSFRLVQKSGVGSKTSVIHLENTGVPKKALDLYRKALEKSKASEHLAAIELLKSAVKQHPAFVLALTEMGIQFVKLNELSKADEYFVNALKVKPDAYEPLVNRGILQFRLSKFAEAEATLRLALVAKENSAVARYYLGRTLVKLNRFDDGEKEFRASIEFGGVEMKEAHRMLASLYLEKGDDMRALESLETYLNLNPTATDADRLRAVLDQLRAAVTRKPKDL